MSILVPVNVLNPNENIGFLNFFEKVGKYATRYDSPSLTAGWEHAEIRLFHRQFIL